MTVNSLKYRFLTDFLEVFGKEPFKSINGLHNSVTPIKPLAEREKTYK